MLLGLTLTPHEFKLCALGWGLVCLLQGGGGGGEGGASGVPPNIVTIIIFILPFRGIAIVSRHMLHAQFIVLLYWQTLGNCENLKWPLTSEQPILKLCVVQGFWVCRIHFWHYFGSFYPT